VKGKDRKSFVTEDNSVKLDLHHLASKFTVLKHDKMMLHSNCWINFSLTEAVGANGATATELSMK